MSAASTESGSPARDEAATPAGPGRLFTFLYGVFAVGASSRAVYQLATKASEAPLAYTLSAVAALIYVAAFVLLLRWGHPGSRAALKVVCIIELTGVLGVGTMTVLWPDLFPHTTVWSYFGVGYLLLPLILPVMVLRWLSLTKKAPSDA